MAWIDPAAVLPPRLIVLAQIPRTPPPDPPAPPLAPTPPEAEAKFFDSMVKIGKEAAKPVQPIDDFPTEADIREIIMLIAELDDE